MGLYLALLLRLLHVPATHKNTNHLAVEKCFSQKNFKIINLINKHSVEILLKPWIKFIIKLTHSTPKQLVNIIWLFHMNTIYHRFKSWVFCGRKLNHTIHKNKNHKASSIYSLRGFVSFIISIENCTKLNESKLKTSRLWVYFSKVHAIIKYPLQFNIITQYTVTLDFPFSGLDFYLVPKYFSKCTLALMGLPNVLNMRSYNHDV